MTDQRPITDCHPSPRPDASTYTYIIIMSIPPCFHVPLNPPPPPHPRHATPHTPSPPPLVAVALLNVTLRVYYMLPKWVQGQVLSKEAEDKLTSTARQVKSVLNVVAVYVQVGEILIYHEVHIKFLL